VAIPPLLPEFLNRRRAKLAYPLERAEALGIDRPSVLWTINLSYRGDRGAAAEPGDLDSVYATIPKRWLPMAAAARGAGLVEERDGRWHLTPKGAELARGMQAATRAHYATLTPLPASELAELSRLLDEAFRSAARAGEPARRLHTPFAFAYRADEPPPGSFAQLDAAVYGLWQVRDDCHMAAWAAEGMTGPDVEVLTRLWRREAEDESSLEELLPHQKAEDVRASLARLRDRGLAERAALRATAEGSRLRQGIEDETDRMFFAPWPDAVGAQSAWIADKLAQVNATLT
jgi:hypothetical protein